MRKFVDAEMVMGWDACWDDNALREYQGERNRVAVKTVLKDENVSRNDRIWLAVECMDDRERRLFACWCAEQALETIRGIGIEPDQRSVDAVAVARRFADGEASHGELAAAWAAAWDAARAAARDAQINYIIEQYIDGVA